MKYSEHLGWFQRKAGTHKINAPHHKNISNSLPSHLCQLVLFRPPTSLYLGRQRLSKALAAEVRAGLDQEFWLESGPLCGLPESADVVQTVASQSTNPSHIKHSLYCYVFFHILLPLVKHASHNSICRDIRSVATLGTASVNQPISPSSKHRSCGGRVFLLMVLGDLGLLKLHMHQLS